MRVLSLTAPWMTWFAPRRTPEAGVGSRARRDATPPREAHAGRPFDPLVVRLRAGDEAALREVWDSHYDRLLAIACRYMGSLDAGMDVVQQVFVGLWERRDTLAPTHTLGAHLAGAVRFRALHELRRGRIHANAVARARRLSDDAESEANLGAIHLDVAETEAAVRDALGALTPRVREIFLLHREGGLTAPQIAAALGITTQVVYNQLSKALKALATGLRSLR